MKSFLALLLVLLGAAPTLGQSSPNDGMWWAGRPAQYKLGFVSGYARAMTSVQNLMMFQCMEGKDTQHPDHEAIATCLQAPEAIRFDFTEIRAGQLADQVDIFYKDPLNRKLEIELAIKYVRDKLKGKSREDLERELKTFRDISTQPHSSK